MLETFWFPYRLEVLAIEKIPSVSVREDLVDERQYPTMLDTHSPGEPLVMPEESVTLLAHAVVSSDEFLEDLPGIVRYFESSIVDATHGSVGSECVRNSHC
ncbi:hypothetical protein HLASA_2047 [Halanaeroarchaeum sulfurireducens]|uniref:Uncharacterized protein n=1 Tax=Halanaeroarchaeum sulfurireducens TaxID=1604004 RepID=A0A0N9MLP3_9EURY|nr:hypothetical protein HLASA_2047 [Halanaeroarchaeum sulfurireducens]